jgi:hypothetical protein
MGKRHRESVWMNMSQELKKTWLPKLQSRYARRNREGKTRMLDEICEDYGYERKYAIKLLGGSLPAADGRPPPGPEPQYGLIEPIVKQIWLSSEQPCGKRLEPILKQWLPYYERHFEKVGQRQRKLINTISPATLDRLLAPARAKHPGRGRCGTKPGSLLKTEIPVRTGTWDVTQPGYLEADCVFRTISDSDSNSNRTRLRLKSDRVPIQIGHRSDLIRTRFRVDIGQFLGATGMVSDMVRNPVRNGPE